MPVDAIQAMEFAQSKGRARKDGKTGTTFADVAGIGYIATELQDIVAVSVRPSPPSCLRREGQLPVPWQQQLRSWRGCQAVYRPQEGSGIGTWAALRVRCQPLPQADSMPRVILTSFGSAASDVESNYPESRHATWKLHRSRDRGGVALFLQH